MAIDLKNYEIIKSSVLTENAGNKKKEHTRSNFLNKEIHLFGNQLSLKKKESFYSELSILLKAGLDLKAVLDLCIESANKEKDKSLIKQIQEAIIKGDDLASAMEKTKKFSAYEIFSIRIAEEGGRLLPVLQELSQYFTKSIQYRRLVVSAMSYPFLVVFVSILALVFLLNFLVPLFGDIYTRLDQELPTITVFIISLSNIVQKYLGKFILIACVTSLFLFSQRKSIWFRKIGSIILLKLPIFGSLIRQLHLSRFSQAMAFMLESKVPLLKAVELVKKVVNFYPIEHSLNKIETDILQGRSLHLSMKQFPIYPRQMIALVKVGEEANQIDYIFKKVSELYNEEVEQKIKVLGSLIEPILIVFLALIVGLVLVSMYLPIFKLVTNFGF